MLFSSAFFVVFKQTGFWHKTNLLFFFHALLHPSTHTKFFFPLLKALQKKSQLKSGEASCLMEKSKFNYRNL
jgi:hypothetical protein